MTSTSGAAVTLSSFGRKLELKPDNDTQTNVNRDELEKHGQDLSCSPPDSDGASEKGPKSHRKLAARPKRFSFPHLRNAIIVISIQRCNKNHINSGFFPFFLATDLISYTFYLKSRLTHTSETKFGLLATLAEI